MTLRTITTPRLTLRQWSLEDAADALEVYGDGDVARWLAPAMDRVADETAMREVLQGWVSQCERLEPPQGRWAVVLTDTDTVIGGAALLPMPPGGEDVEVAWQLARTAWGHGYAAEAGHALAHHAFDTGVEEVFAVVRPSNSRGAATAQRVGMEWVGETEKYYDLRLQVYRVRKGDLDVQGRHS